MTQPAADGYQDPPDLTGPAAEGPPVGLFVLTAFLGVLVALDVFVTRGQPLFGWGWRPAMLAAVLGGTRVTFASLSGALDGEVGADLALAVATWAALAIGEPIAAAEVVFIAMTGESLEAIAFSRTAKALTRLLSLWPATARIEVDGEEVEVPSAEVPLGATVIVRPGERLPVDGVILDGVTSLDESTLTGESVPVDREPGDAVRSGTQNLLGAIRVRADRVGSETVMGQVVRLVHEAQARQAPVQRAVDVYASYFLPAVLLAAALTFGLTRDWYRTVAVLVVACPCALVLATPAAVLAGIGRLARHGVLVKSGEALEVMARVGTLAFDKTGTLTLGRLTLADVEPMPGVDAADLLAAAAAAESGSEHPLAAALVAGARARGVTWSRPTTFEARPGAGMLADDGRLVVGTTRLFDELGVAVPPAAATAAERLAATGQTVVLVAADGQVLGVLGARDRLRADAVESVARLHQLGLRRLALLTGDRPEVAAVVAREVGLEEVLASQLPTDKAAWVRARRNAGERVAMVGDGINDALALAEADLGVAVAESGSDLAAEAADVVLLGDPLAQVPELVSLSRQVLATIRLSVFGFAFGLNGVAVLLSATGKLQPVQAAVFHQVGSLAVLLNALRLLGFEPQPASLAGRLGARLHDGLQAVLGLDLDGFVGWLAQRWRAILRLKLTVIAIWWLSSCLVLVGPDEVGVVRLLGRHWRTYGPGVAVKPWWPLGRCTRLRPREVRYLELGYRSLKQRTSLRQAAQYDWNSPHLAGGLRRMADEALMLTGDENFVEIQATVQYTIARPAAYLFAASNPDDQLRAFAAEALRQVVGQTALDDALTTGRHPLELAAATRLQATCDAAGLGVRVEEIELADVHPPLEVVPAFRAVSSAAEQKQQQINEAEAYANEQVALARGEAAARRSAALAFRAGRAVRAAGDADRFTARRLAAATGRPVTFSRLYFEAVERVLAGRRKMVLDPEVTARRQFWLLDPKIAEALKVFANPPAAPTTPPTFEDQEAEQRRQSQPAPPKPNGAPPPDDAARNPLPGLPADQGAKQ